MRFFHNFDDEFFFMLGAVCTLLIFTDWLIGPLGRAKMREKLADWWIRLESNTFAGLVAEDAGKIARFFRAVFGERWFSWRRIVLTMGFSIFLTIFLARVMFGRNIPVDTAELILVLILANAISDWLSLNITIFLLELMEKSVSLVKLTFLIMLDIIVVICCAMVAVILFSATNIFIDALGWGDALTDFLGQYFDPAPERRLMANFSFGLMIALGIVIPLIFVTTSLWSYGHIVLSIGFVISKLFRPVIKPVISLLLYRFQESKKGVLTLVAIGGGALIKLGQQAIKIYSG
jgi:hypothetical protein